LVTLLLASGFDPNGVDDQIGEWYATTPFAEAAKHERLDLMELLVEAGADPHWKNSNGANAASAVLPSSSVQDRRPPTPGLTRIAEWLEQRNIRIDPASEHSQRKLFYAAYTHESWKDIPNHLTRGIPPEGLKWTPFMLKIALGEATETEAATQTRAELDHRDSWSRTPFLLAVVAGRADIAEALLNAGSDPLAVGRCGLTPLHHAAREDHTDMTTWLLGMGHPVDSLNDHGDTALITAAGTNSLRAAQILLDAGANAGANENRAIHEASSFEMIALLLRFGACVNSTFAGDWPLKTAASRGDAALVKYLLNAGAAVDLTSSGETALFGAVRRGSLECVGLLLDAGANINAQDCDGWTCLWVVESVDMAELLLSRGADPSIADQCNQLPEDRTLPPQVCELFRGRRTASPEEAR
jgi:ankyrin repeat protein